MIAAPRTHLAATSGNKRIDPNLIRWFELLTSFALMLAISMSCTTDKVDPEERNAGGQNGYLIGKVTNQAGKGIENATIYIENTVFTNRGAQVASSAMGDYKLALVEGLGQWTARGFILTRFNSRVYKTLLHPDNADSFSAEEKPVRNFVWQTQGQVADMSLNMYYGGSAELYRDPNSLINDSENVEFTFIPEGILIDGSHGKTLKLSCGKSGSSNYNIIHDIPIGRYKVTAIYKPTGKALLVSDAWGDGIYRRSVTMEFFGTESSYRANQMGIGYMEQ